MDPSRLTGELSRSLDRLKAGNARTPAFSPSLVRMLSRPGRWARSTTAAAGFAPDSPFWRWLRTKSLRGWAGHGRECRRFKPRSLREQFTDDRRGLARGDRDGRRRRSPAAPRRTARPNLDQFTVDLTDNARQGKIDPVLGRDFEIRQMVDILMRRRQNNPILTGEAGVGKTAVVEGFALRVAHGDVPPPLRNVDGALARPGAAAGRRGHQRRIRKPAEGVDRGGEGVARRRSFCSSTKRTR